MLSIKNVTQNFIIFLKRYQAAILSGILTGTSYIPFFPWAFLFNYIPLWWYWSKRAESRKQILWSGWLCQFIFNLIGFHWVYHTAHEFGHIPTPLSLIVLILFASLAHLYVPLVGFLFFELKKMSTNGNSTEKSKQKISFSLILSLLGLWALAEIYWPSIFQWHMGYTFLWAKLPAFHLADVIGFQGLSYVLLIFNGFLLWWFSDCKKLNSSNTNSFWIFDIFKLKGFNWFKDRQTLKGISISIVAFVFLNLAGWFHGLYWNIKRSDQILNFLPIQANIGNSERIMAERGYGYQDFIVQKFITMSKQALAEHPDSQILVWPESAIPDYLDPEFSARHRPQLIQNFLKESNRFLITGAYSKETKKNSKLSKALNSDQRKDSNSDASENNDEETIYNALFIFNPQGQLLAPAYKKKHLLAFGEYTPFADWFPKLNEISPSGKGFARGPGAQSLTLSDPALKGLTLRVAPQICYESLYPEYTRQGVLEGAQILVNVTNDSWFGYHSEPYQNLSMTFARAIENRRPLLRVTNTGFTSAIEASGKILATSPLYKEWSDNIPIHFDENPPLTFYTQFGGFLPLLILLITLLGIKSLRRIN